MEGLNEERILVVAHCLLDPWTRVKGLQPVAFEPKGPVLQLPCPEALYLGLDRWAATKNQLDVPEFRRFCRELLWPCADLMEMLVPRGVKIIIVGVAGSPSCGIESTSEGYSGGRVHEAEHRRVSGRGIFMEELARELERRGLETDWMEV